MEYTLTGGYGYADTFEYPFQHDRSLTTYYPDLSDFHEILDAEVVMSPSASFEEYTDAGTSDAAAPADSVAFFDECTALITQWDDQTDYLLIPDAHQILPPSEALRNTCACDERRRVVLLIPGNGTTDRSVIKVTLVVQDVERCIVPPS